VCPRAPVLAVRRLPTSRTLARWTGWVHIPFPPGPRGPPSNPRPTSGDRQRPPTGPPPRPTPGTDARGRPTPRLVPDPLAPAGLPATSQTLPLLVSTSYRSRPSARETDGVRSRVRDTGLRPPLRSMRGARPHSAPRSTSGRCSKRSSEGKPGGVDTRRHPSTGPMGGTSRFSGAWIRSVSSTR
jgi:hypothetical protein